MAAEVPMFLFAYLAHIQKENGETIELEGRRMELTYNSTYAWLSQRAKELGGYLINQVITKSRETHVAPPVRLALPAPQEPPATPHSIFTDSKICGRIANEYAYVPPVTFKVTTGE